MADLYKIVIADDEPMIRDGLVHLFPWEDFGFRVVASLSNGKEVVDYLEQHPDIDVVMTDIRMPQMDGLRLSELLAKRSTRVVIFSAYKSFDYAQSAVRSHVFDYLVKPVKYEDLSSCFERLYEVLEKEHHRETDRSGRPQKNADKVVAKVASYIENNLADCSLEEAARVVYLSPKYLSSLFHERMGISFSEYVQKKRMQKALKLLDDPSVFNYQIAAMLGYDNPKNFTRAFKSYYGIAPQEYRNGGQLLRNTDQQEEEKK